MWMADPIDVLDFWLGEVGPDGWYARGNAVDDKVRARYLDLWQAALEGGLEHWLDGAPGALAYLIVTDQFPRNLFRDDPRSFATDPQARAASARAIAAGWDLDAPEPERQFFYLPLMHSEDPEDQATCIAMVANRMPDTGADTLHHARVHAEAIRRFGRFPHRNAALGRQSTPDEAQFLAEGGYPALVKAMRA